MQIAIVGRGVIGLSCGLVLAREGHQVTLVSRPKSAGEVITSEVAAAFWFPYLTQVDPNATYTEEDLALPTLGHLHALLKEPRAAVSLAQGVEYLGTPAGRHGIPQRWWHSRPEIRFRTLPPAEVP